MIFRYANACATHRGRTDTEPCPSCCGRQKKKGGPKEGGRGWTPVSFAAQGHRYHGTGGQLEGMVGGEWGKDERWTGGCAEVEDGWHDGGEEDAQAAARLRMEGREGVADAGSATMSLRVPAAFLRFACCCRFVTLFASVLGLVWC